MKPSRACSSTAPQYSVLSTQYSALGTPYSVRRTRYAAFTLVELLIVVAIIGILVALSAGAVVRYIGTQQQNNTEIMMRKVNTVLQSLWNEVVKRARDEPIPPAVRTMANNDERRARVIYIKLRLQQEFPINFAEAGGLPSFPLPPIQDYVQKVRSRTGGRPETESAACLLMALERARGGQRLDAQDLGVAAVADTDGDGLQEIIDAWGTPVKFIRWPWKSPDLNPGGTAGLDKASNDPVDPEGLLVTSSWTRGPFEGLVHPLPTSLGRSFKLIPVIVSAGPNRAMGIDDNAGILPGRDNDALDNIHNYTLFRLGARGE